MSLPKLNFLFSFAYAKSVDGPLLDALLDSTNVLIDSGAFTNHRAGLKGKEAPVKLPDYVAFCKRIDDRVWQYIALDVIGQPVQTKANLATMLDAGLRPMPVFVHGASYDLLEELGAISDWRLCVAGGVDRNNYIRHRYQKTFRESGGRAKIHGLGFVRCPDIFRLPLSTVDSASYYNGSVYGKVFRYDKTKGEWDCPGYRELRKPKYARILRDVARCGITADYMNDLANTRGLFSWPSLFTVNNYLTFHEHATRQGPSYFFALPGPSWVIAIAAVLATRRGDLFDYPESRAIYTRLNEAYKQNKALAAQEVGRILTEGTTQRSPNDYATNRSPASNRAV